ncbi:hypothetical protein B7494_g553 [Chlorociboria aeruginascens]|nr:hypothetical protein B7494_g553 [Chlorociboria aeruginascens]
MPSSTSSHPVDKKPSTTSSGSAWPAYPSSKPRISTATAPPPPLDSDPEDSDEELQREKIKRKSSISRTQVPSMPPPIYKTVAPTIIPPEEESKKGKSRDKDPKSRSSGPSQPPLVYKTSAATTVPKEKEKEKEKEKSSAPKTALLSLPPPAYRSKAETSTPSLSSKSAQLSKTTTSKEPSKPPKESSRAKTVLEDHIPWGSTPPPATRIPDRAAHEAEHRVRGGDPMGQQPTSPELAPQEKKGKATKSSVSSSSRMKSSAAPSSASSSAPAGKSSVSGSSMSKDLVPYKGKTSSSTSLMPSSRIGSVASVVGSSRAVATSDVFGLSAAQTQVCLRRLYSEMNWDWWDVYRPGFKAGDRQEVEQWLELLEQYDHWCHAQRAGHDYFGMAMQPRNGGLRELHTDLHNMLYYFMDGDGVVMEMIEALKNGGNWLDFVDRRCKDAGFDYPGGTGRTMERIRPGSNVIFYPFVPVPRLVFFF